MWQAKWWTDTVPNHDPNGDWTEGFFVSFVLRMAVADAFLFQVSACQGGQEVDPGQEPNGPPTGVGYTITHGMPTGALANGETAVHRQAYFRKPRYVQVPSLFLFHIFTPPPWVRLVGGGGVPSAGIDGKWNVEWSKDGGRNE